MSSTCLGVPKGGGHYGPRGGFWGVAMATRKPQAKGHQCTMPIVPPPPHAPEKNPCRDGGAVRTCKFWILKPNRQDSRGTMSAARCTGARCRSSREPIPPNSVVDVRTHRLQRRLLRLRGRGNGETYLRGVEVTNRDSYRRRVHQTDLSGRQRGPECSTSTRRLHANWQHGSSRHQFYFGDEVSRRSSRTDVTCPRPGVTCSNAGSDGCNDSNLELTLSGRALTAISLMMLDVAQRQPSGAMSTRQAALLRAVLRRSRRKRLRPPTRSRRARTRIRPRRARPPPRSA